MFGCDLRVPQSILEENSESILFMSGVIHGVNRYQRAQEIRQAARRAMVAVDDEERLRKACLHRTRDRREELNVGDYVFYWRRGKESKQGTWRGPARVIGFFESKSRVWVSHGNKVFRCSYEQLRHLTEDQVQAKQCVSTDLLQPVPKGSKRGAQVFTDISQEGSPPENERELKRRREVEVEQEDEQRRKEEDGEQGGSSMATEEETTEQPQSDDMSRSEREDGVSDQLVEPEAAVPPGPAAINPLPVAPVALSIGGGQTEGSYGPVRTTDLT